MLGILMRIPSLLYGRRGQVASRAQKLARQLLETRDFSNYEPGLFLDTQSTPGLILTDKEWQRSSANNFHCYALSQALLEVSSAREARDNMHQWLMASLDSEWRFLCTLGGQSPVGLADRDPSFGLRYVEAAIRHWPNMKQEMDRFGPVLSGHDVLDLWFTLTAALEMLGLPPVERMTAPDRQPQALLDMINRRKVPL